MCHLRYCVVKLMDLLRINLFWKTRFRAENSSLNHLSRALFNTYQLNLLWWNGPGYCVFYEKVLSLLAFTRPIIESHVHFFRLHFFTLCKNTFFTHCDKIKFVQQLRCALKMYSVSKHKKGLQIWFWPGPVFRETARK